MNTEKVIVIGAGPAGLAASIYLARADLFPLLVSGVPAGGQLMLTSEVENYPGFESIMGPELIAKMKSHAMHFGAQYINDKVIRIEVQKSLTVHTADKSYTTKAILIATGADAVWLSLPSEQRLRGKGVSACATCDGFFFKNKVVGVVGGGDTAMEEALTLSKFATKVYVIHRRGEFRASKIMQKRVMEHPKIETIWHASVVEVLGENRVEGVRLNKTNSNQSEPIQQSLVLKLEGIFIAIGHKPTTDFLKNTPILRDDHGYIITSLIQAWNEKKGHISNTLSFNFAYQYETSIKGIFAAGDVIDPHFRQAATAVGMGVSAALEIERYLSQQQ